MAKGVLEDADHGYVCLERAETSDGESIIFRGSSPL